ncbi:MAG: hypothetical protein O2914_00350 [Bacteroidetes bacterium]|nr:hypothetical protein [Bacteroidota bacterium]MDA0937264.1 hypothetical protein [Bacteroidota bacterium]MDA1345401.1 hypothetical protein [Bacteroidota bacterium]
MNQEKTATKIIELKTADLCLRDQLLKAGLLQDGYHPQMEKLHLKNARTLDTIIQKMGYPTIDKVGKAASEAAWLVIQHAISNPSFMKKCQQLLQKAVEQGKANPRDLAYLSDRIATFENRPQLHGTAFDWDQKGLLSPKRYDNLQKVNQRRKALGLIPLEDQIKKMQKQAKKEGQQPPKDFKNREKALRIWQKKVGWISS